MVGVGLMFLFLPPFKALKYYNNDSSFVDFRGEGD